jgi:hypothetical protein
MLPGSMVCPLSAERRRTAPMRWQRLKDWERGRVKAVSREAVARKREP